MKTASSKIRAVATRSALAALSAIIVIHGGASAQPDSDFVSLVIEATADGLRGKTPAAGADGLTLRPIQAANAGRGDSRGFSSYALDFDIPGPLIANARLAGDARVAFLTIGAGETIPGVSAGDGVGFGTVLIGAGRGRAWLSLPEGATFNALELRPACGRSTGSSGEDDNARLRTLVDLLGADAWLRPLSEVTAAPVSGGFEFTLDKAARVTIITASVAEVPRRYELDDCLTFNQPTGGKSAGPAPIAVAELRAGKHRLRVLDLLPGAPATNAPLTVRALDTSFEAYSELAERLGIEPAASADVKSAAQLLTLLKGSKAGLPSVRSPESIAWRVGSVDLPPAAPQPDTIADE